MLAALLVAFLLSGGGVAGGILSTDAVKQVGKQVDKAVHDEARAAKAAETLGELKTEIKTFEKSFAKSGKELGKLYKDHGGNADAMQAVLDGLNTEWGTAQRRGIDLRFELRDSLTEEEWVAVFGDD